MRKTYPRPVFLALYQAIAQKLLEHRPPVQILNSKGRQDTNALGVKWEGPGGPLDNASAVIHAELVESKILDKLKHKDLNFGKQLYDKYNALERNKDLQQVVIQGLEYNEGLRHYIGPETFQTFWEPHTPVNPNAEDANLPTHPVKDPPFTYYIGAYYSFRSYRINKFVLAIRHTDKPSLPMECWQWGFHNTERLVMPNQLPERVNSVQFKGTATVRGRHLYINLEAPASENTHAMEMHLIGLCDESGGHNLQDQEAIPASLQTVSFDQYTVSAETYLLRCTEAEAQRVMHSPEAYYSHQLPAEALLQKPSRAKALQLYFMLQRRNFRVKYRPNVSNLDNLEYRGNHVNNYTERLGGEYRIWNFGLRRGVVIQSKLVISTEVPYRAYFYPFLNDELKRNNPGLEEQLAVLVISNEIRQDQLCFATFVKRRLSLVNYAIFDIRNLRDDNWVEGMFITTGYDKKGIIGGYAVMCKVKPGENCQPLHMDREAAVQYAETLGLKEMHDGLRSLWKRKLWKQKSNTQFACYAVVQDSQKGILMVRQVTGPFKGDFELPGGTLKHGETPEIGLQRLVAESTGVNIQNCTLWVNESVSKTWERPDNINENLHLVGALYRVASEDIKFGQLHKQAFWIKPGQYDRDAFSPFAQKAMDAFL